MAPLLALASAACFGAADIIGAIVSRRTSAIWVSLALQVTGMPLLLVSLLVVPGELSVRALGLGAVAGSAGILGLVLYLRSLAVGPVGVISPLAALVGAAVPVGWGVALGGDRLLLAEVVGVGLGLVAVVLVAWSPQASTRAYGRRGPAYALLAGTTFGLYFVLLDATPAGSGLWPLVASRTAGALLLVAVLLVVRRPAPPRDALRLLVVGGTVDTLATLSFLLATRQGLLSLVALLASLSPVVALVLARFLLKERLTALQASGVAVAMLAIGLIVT